MSVQLAANELLPALNADAAIRLQVLLEQHISSTPLAHLMGQQQFMGIELQISDDALIPREETELLGNAALIHIQNIVRQIKTAVVIDVCPGSGNLAIAHHVPLARVCIIDFITTGVALAQQCAKTDSR